MNHGILHLTAGDNESSRNLSDLDRFFEKQGFLISRFDDVDRALAHLRSQPLAGVLIDVDSSEAIAFATKARDSERLDGAPLIGLSANGSPTDEQEKLVEAGFSCILGKDAPYAFFVYQFQTAQKLQSLRQLEETGMSIQTMATEARHLLHELSQPLATIQGRLQLLAMQATDNEVFKKHCDDLAGVTMAANTRLAELQQLIRKYS